MKTRKYINTIKVVATIILLLIVGLINTTSFHAVKGAKGFNPGDAMYESLSPAGQSAALAMGYGVSVDQDRVVDTYINGRNRNANVIEVFEAALNNGYFANRIEDLRAAGLIHADFQITGASNATATTPAATNTAPAQPAAKTDFTVTDVEPYSAWATQDCNIRSGADTTYDKVGGLKKHEGVTVTGVASTGWFRIRTASGTEAYVSNTLVTTEDPSNREYTTVNDSGEILTYEFTDTDPEIIDQIIEEIEAEPVEEHVHDYKAEITKEATCTEPGEITYTCVDGDDSYTEEIPKLNHEEGEWVVTKKATLTTAGEKVQYCQVGGEVLNTEEIPANTRILVVVICACVAVVVTGITIGVMVYKNSHRKLVINKQ